MQQQDKRDNRPGHSDGISKSPDCVDVSTDTLPIVTSQTKEGEDFVDFNQLLESNQYNNPEGSVLRRYTRQHKMPARFDNYELDKKIRYGTNVVVSYANLSIENYVFSNNLNKIHEPKSYAEAASDPRWVEAMNKEMKALNNNNT
nr:putative reverse transcriptase, RNA-dependent DNA polymerase, Gag-polypeptide of LTR copia-type [Tanacetum cinerariifolium]